MWKNRRLTLRRFRLDWLVQSDNAAPSNGHSRKPSTGHGDGQHHREDATAVVRRHFRAEAGRYHGDPVTGITVTGGAQSGFGQDGNHSPYPYQNCDIDASVEYLQFWWALAGVRNVSL